MVTISADRLQVKIHDLWANQWFLLTSGDFKTGQFNSMTVAWGSLGIMWSMPFAQVVVRPIRYTYEFMERYDTFTLCAFPRKYRKQLNFLGSVSGRKMDKIQSSGLTPCAASVVAAPVFAEAELRIECRKMYWSDLEPEHFLNAGIAAIYDGHDFHRMYFGEIVALTGDEKYLSLN
jgi:flavin reductase (DIM6/NTAB) family NADH-FMN oxidoreductase RutF